jgi:hypothetical protein
LLAGPVLDAFVGDVAGAKSPEGLTVEAEAFEVSARGGDGFGRGLHYRRGEVHVVA